jgi:hypothetical protein
MSSTFSVYAVPFDRLKRVLGSRDRDLIEAIAGAHEHFFAQIDEMADEEDEVTSCSGAPAQVVEGAPLAGSLGYVYGRLVPPRILATRDRATWLPASRGVASLPLPIRLLRLGASFPFLGPHPYRKQKRVGFVQRGDAILVAGPPELEAAHAEGRDRIEELVPELGRRAGKRPRRSRPSPLRNEPLQLMDQPME